MSWFRRSKRTQSSRKLRFQRQAQSIPKYNLGTRA
ncbi:MAG: hypothetical protein QOG51_316 [Verrucomicrobiota bacterium]|jgi:hypothetical protein